MSLYCQEVRKLEGKFDNIDLKHIPRKLNKAVDSLAKMVSKQEMIPSGIFVSYQSRLLIRLVESTGWIATHMTDHRGSSRCETPR